MSENEPCSLSVSVSPTVPTVADTYDLGNRERSDGCPGSLTMHTALDGKIGRIRMPGGAFTSETLNALATLAETFGDGDIHITTRGNVQVRGISEEKTQAFAAAAEDLGLLPSRAHDKIRNIMASPLARFLVPLVAELDTALQANTIVAGLSGRTLFGLDGGTGDIYAKRPDFGAFALLTTPNVIPDYYQIILAGVLQPWRVHRTHLAAVLVNMAACWQEIRGSSWRVQENPDAREKILDMVSTSMGVDKHPLPELPEIDQLPGRPIGWITTGDGRISLGAGLRWAKMSSKIARLLASTQKPVTLTPWGSVVLHDLTPDEADAALRILAPLGLIFDENDPWLRVTACTGLPECSKSASDVRADAYYACTHNQLPAGLIHFSGCIRRCGHPLLPYTDYLAESEGTYEIEQRTGQPATIIGKL